MISRKIIAAIVAVGLTVVVAGCSGKDEPQGSDPGIVDPAPSSWAQPPLPGGLGEKVNQEDPESVANGFLSEFFTWRPEEDASPADAAERASVLMDEPLVDSHRNSWSAMAGIPGDLWQAWQGAETRSVTIKPAHEQRPGDTDREVYRQYHVTVHQKDDVVEYDVFMKLEKLGWWRVAQLQLSAPVLSKNSDEQENE